MSKAVLVSFEIKLDFSVIELNLRTSVTIPIRKQNNHLAVNSIDIYFSE